jgi:hypothetical protein
MIELNIVTASALYALSAIPNPYGVPCLLTDKATILPGVAIHSDVYRPIPSPHQAEN